MTFSLQSYCSPSWANPPFMLAPPQGFEPRNVGIKIRCLRPTWRRGYCLASRQRLELRPRVLETHVLPLHQRDNQLLNALLPMRVLKSTVCDISVQVSSMLFNTLGFFYVQEHKPSPRPPICSLKWCRLALPLHLMKNPGVFSPGVLLYSLRLDSWNLFSYKGPRASWNTIRWCKTAWPGRCLGHHILLQQCMFNSFHYKSYCTVFSDCCQPLNGFSIVLFIQRDKNYFLPCCFT